MDLLLWRHAEAVEGLPDHDRALTDRGHEQAERVAAWLHAHRPKNLRILVSPTLRTRQTAMALTDAFTLVPSLGPTATTDDLLAASGWPDGGDACLIVGHQPVLGQLAVLLLANVQTDCSIRKGALWWFRRRIRAGEMQTILRTVISPDLL